MKILIHTIAIMVLLPICGATQHFSYDHLKRQLQLYSPSDPVPSIHFRNTSTTADWILKHDGIKFHFQTESNSGHEKFTIQSNGNIGIGITSPEQKLHVVGKAKISEMERVLSPNSNVVRQLDGTLAIRKYEVGDLAHGGIVFWVDESGEHGLVASQSDLKSTPEDSTHLWSAAEVTTGATGGTVAGGNVDGKGAGAMNTMLIVSADRVDTDSAARLCADLVEGGYGDWYLPSKGELHLLYSNLHLAGLGSFSTDLFYWSSSEHNDFDAWLQDFNDGNQYTFCKDNYDVLVRAVRAF